MFQFTEKKLAKIIIKELKSFDSGLNPVYNKEESCVTYDDSGSIFLGNIFNIVKNYSRRERTEYVRAFISETRNKVETMDENAFLSRIFPRLKTVSANSLRDMQLKQLSGTDPGFTRLDYAYPLQIELVIDSETTVASVTDETLQQFNIDFDQAYSQAVANLARISEHTFEPLCPGTYCCRMSDDFDSSRMILTDTIERLDLNGDPVAFIPSHRTLWVTGSRDSDMIEKLSEAAKKETEEVRMLSLLPFILEDGKWKRFQGNEPKSAQVVKELEYIEQLNDYGEQTELLDQINEKQGMDVFVAKYSVYNNEDKGLFSIATWSEDVHTWLPEAELIAFVRVEDGKPEMLGTAEWANVKEVLSHKLKEMENIYPKRYEVTEFPSTTELSALSLQQI